MRFYIGLHMPNHANEFEDCFVSVNRLRGRKSDFAVNNWILDSGAFSELVRFGYYTHSVADYATEIGRWSRCGRLELAVCQDYMCEPFMVEKTGLSVAEHQYLTIQRYDELYRLSSVPIMPVLQGYQPSDYQRHMEMYGDRLRSGMRVGVGSVCKRNTDIQQVATVLEGIKSVRPDLQLHGFGLKTTALLSSYICSLLYSADSMAWSWHARKNGRNANSIVEARNFYEAILRRHGTQPHQLALCQRQGSHLPQSCTRLP